MFIKQLYHYNKYWLAVFLCFILLFFYINYKWGVVATPVYQYGMFSGKYRTSDTITVFKFYVDGKELNPTAMHFTQKDMIYTMAERFERTNQHPMLIYETMNGVFNKLGLGDLVAETQYFQNLSASGFANWLLKYSNSYAATLKLEKQLFIWKDRALVPVSASQSTIIETN